MFPGPSELLLKCASAQVRMAPLSGWFQFPSRGRGSVGWAIRAGTVLAAGRVGEFLISLSFSLHQSPGLQDLITVCPEVAQKGTGNGNSSESQSLAHAP